MLILAIDTTTAGCGLALLRDGVVLARHEEALQRGQDGVLAARVGELMAGAGLDLQSLDRLAVVTGPGSFTGTRIGVAFARGLSLALGVACVGVTSLMAARAPDGLGEGYVLVLLPAQVRPPERTWWAQLFRGGRAISWPMELGEGDFEARFGLYPGVVVCEAGACPAAFQACLPPEPGQTAVNAALWAGRLDPSLDPPVPAYVRAPDAVPAARRGENA